MSVNEMGQEQCHPMILSNILNPDKQQNIDRLSLLKLRNNLSELRQAQFDLGEYVEDQRKLMEEFRERISFQFQDFLAVFVEHIARGTNSQERGLEDTTALRTKLKNTELNYQKACQEI